MGLRCFLRLCSPLVGVQGACLIPLQRVGQRLHEGDLPLLLLDQEQCEVGQVVAHGGKPALQLSQFLLHHRSFF